MKKLIKKLTATVLAVILVLTTICVFSTDNVAKANSNPTVKYMVHRQSYSWEKDWKTNGQSSGTVGEGKRLESIKIKVEGANLGIQYRTHIQSFGWESEWRADGALSGTEGLAKRLEAIQIKLTGADAGKYDVYYRVHAQTYGWMGWVKNGESAGTAGQAKRLEAIQIVILPKGTYPSEGSMGCGFVDIAKKPSHTETGVVTYMTHVQSYGNQAWVSDGSIAGTSGEAKRLEQISIKVNNAKLDNISGGIEYKTHVQSYGWMDWVKDGNKSGTSGQGKRLEGIKIRLTGELANKFDVYYRVHAQSYGWLGWVKNGAPSGTEGYAKRLEAIQIVVVPKNTPAPNALPAKEGQSGFVSKTGTCSDEDSSNGTSNDSSDNSSDDSSEEPSKEPTDDSEQNIPAGTPISEGEWAGLLRGGSDFVKLSYFVRVAEECYINQFQDNYFKYALLNIWFEPTVEGVYDVCRDDRLCVYDINELNNLFSFFGDEKINNSNISDKSYIVGNELYYYGCDVSKGDKIITTITGAEYGKSGDILVNYHFERKHADISLGYYIAGESIMHLKKDSQGKYLFDYIEEISSEKVNY